LVSAFVHARARARAQAESEMEKLEREALDEANAHAREQQQVRDHGSFHASIIASRKSIGRGFERSLLLGARCCFAFFFSPVPLPGSAWLCALPDDFPHR
jgi:hypothetical protein